MTPERWRQVTDVFHAALVRDVSARADYLDRACADDGSLREEVEASRTVRHAALCFDKRSSLKCFAA